MKLTRSQALSRRHFCFCCIAGAVGSATNGWLTPRAELREFRDMLVVVRDSVASLKKQGRSPGETIAAKPTAAFDAKFGNFVIGAGFFTRLVHEGV